MVEANRFQRKCAAAVAKPVTIKVERAGSEAPSVFHHGARRGAAADDSQRLHVRPGTGYIGLTGGFQRSSDEELREAIEKLEEQGMRQLILDLRGNPGGLPRPGDRRGE